MNILGEFIRNIREFGLEHFNRFYSVYPGVVLDINDPEKRGRIKVKVPQIYGDKAIASWADPASKDLAGKGHGEFFPPYVGDYVHVAFEMGDIRFPIYYGGYYARSELPSDFTSGYGNVRGWVFKSGQKILVDEC